MTRSTHQQRVDEFMKLSQQEVPTELKIPSLEIRRLRARLILKECLKTIRGLGFELVPEIHESKNVKGEYYAVFGKFDFIENCEPDLIEIADGCADIFVVTTGTLTACGIDDEELQQEVDESTLRKFELPRCTNPQCYHFGVEMQQVKDRHYKCGGCNQESFEGPYKDENGKWQKPLYWKKPDIKKVIGLE